MRCSIEVCDDHKDDVHGYVLSDLNKETIVTTLMNSGLPEPDFLSARFEFKPIMPAALAAVAAPFSPDGADRPLIEPAAVVGCDRVDCTNPAQWRVIQRFRTIAQGGKGPPVVEALTNMHVCTKHKREVKAADFLGTDDRERTLAFLRERGILFPDVDRPVIDFVQLVGGEPEANRIKSASAQ